MLFTTALLKSIIVFILILFIFYGGIEDKLVATDGYGIVVTDEASAFFQDIKGQDNKNESNIGLMNQCGDKMSLAQLRQRYVPINSTSMYLGVQPQPFFKALTSIGKTVWMDSGFAERYLFTTVRPLRYIFKNFPVIKYSREIFHRNISEIYS